MAYDYKGYRIEVYGNRYWPTGVKVYKDGEFHRWFTPIGMYGEACKKAQEYVDGQTSIDEREYVVKRIAELLENLESWRGDYTQYWSQTKEGLLERLEALLGDYTVEP